MAKTANNPVKQPATCKARRVSIPAGYDYVTVKPGEEVLILDPSGLWPEKFRKHISNAEETAYKKGLQDGREMMVDQGCNRPINVKSVVGDFFHQFSALTTEGQKDTIAAILNSIITQNKHRIQQVATEIDVLQSEEAKMRQEAQDFEDIVKGGFSNYKIIQ